MAKIMVSIPDDLLDEIDREARSRGLSRSGFLQDLARHELADDSARRRAEIDRLLSPPMRFDGRGAQHVREDRRRR
jgi:metal-responsive CopG/Arc/MetJ family transcriptional regulator